MKKRSSKYHKNNEFLICINKNSSKLERKYLLKLNNFEEGTPRMHVMTSCS